MIVILLESCTREKHNWSENTEANGANAYHAMIRT